MYIDDCVSKIAELEGWRKGWVGIFFYLLKKTKQYLKCRGDGREVKKAESSFFG